MNHETVGVECALCHQETFRIQRRLVTIEAGCCPRCTRQHDDAVAEKEAAASMEKGERCQLSRERSHAWADGLHGKRVTIYWVSNTAPVFVKAPTGWSAHGIAYRKTNGGGGYGQVMVVLDDVESQRISLKRAHFFHGKYTRDEEYHIDGKRWGIAIQRLPTGEYYECRAWGERFSLLED